MAIDLYSTNELAGVIRTLKPPRTYWLDLCFPRQQNFDTDTIDFDMVDKQRILAPFVAPTVAGKVMKQHGFTTKQFRPAYVKTKGTVDPRRVFKRMAGEAYTGTMSPNERRQAIIADMLGEHLEAHTRRREWMAVNALVEDQVVVSGEDYPTQTVTFGRAANQKVALTGTAAWGESAAAILDNIELWSERVFEASGYAPTHLIMGLTAWSKFRKDANVQKALDINFRGGTSGINVFEAGNGQYAQYRGMFGTGSLQVWTYNDTYIDEAGNSQPMMNQKKVVLLNPAGIEGVRAFGAIIDPQAGYQAVDLYSKNWISDDPAAEWLMTQSAPLMIPTRPNAALVAQVVE